MLERAKEQIERETTPAIRSCAPRWPTSPSRPRPRSWTSSLTPEAQKKLVDEFVASLEAQRRGPGLTGRMASMSEIAKIFKGLPKKFQKGKVTSRRVFYFSLDDDEKWTVTLGKDKCEVDGGQARQDADCFFKASKQMFLDVWNGKHTPSAKDFLTGTIKSNNPMLLKEFVAAFGK